MAAGGEGELVDGAFADGPLVHGVPGGLGLTGVDGEALALLEGLVGRDGVGAEDVVVVDVHAATRMGG